MRSCVAAAAMMAVAALLVSGCESGKAEELSDQWKLNECRANMNTLATDQALYMLTTGEWTGSVAKLDSIGKRRRPLVCPSCGREYTIDLHANGYVISCPLEEHGSVDTGVPSWGPSAEGATAEAGGG
jgi:hypothetical protein